MKTAALLCHHRGLCQKVHICEDGCLDERQRWRRATETNNNRDTSHLSSVYCYSTLYHSHWKGFWFLFSLPSGHAINVITPSEVSWYRKSWPNYHEISFGCSPDNDSLWLRRPIVFSSSTTITTKCSLIHKKLSNLMARLLCWSDSCLPFWTPFFKRLIYHNVKHNDPWQWLIWRASTQTSLLYW